MTKFLLLSLVGTAACASPEQAALRAAVDTAEYSLADTIGLAEARIQHSTGIDARVHADGDARFTVDTVAASSKHEVTLDLGGRFLAETPAGTAGPSCDTAISLTDALSIAAASAGGDPVAVVPDDDDPCLREIQVLVGLTLWEVKVGPEGAVVEKELSDETF